MQDNAQISVHSHLDLNAALFSIEQTGATLSCRLHIGNVCTNSLIIDPNYNFEELDIKVRRIGNEIRYLIYKHQQFLYEGHSPLGYNYARAIS